jgi:hypothetical protein
MILGKHIGSICIIWTVFGIYDIPTQLWVLRDLDKQGNLSPPLSLLLSYDLSFMPFDCDQCHGELHFMTLCNL